MRTNKKYLVAVAFLAVLAVVFGLAGTVMPISESPLSSSPPESVTHFMNPPTYDSNWTDITDKRGQFFNVTHDLNTKEALVDVVGRQSLSGGDHKLFLGTTIYIEGLNQTYGGTSPDRARSMIPTSDGGYALAGYTQSFGTGPSDFWLVKTDNWGNEQWSQPCGGKDYDDAYSLVQTFDGGYAIAGQTTSGAGGYDYLLFKTDLAGNAEWSRTYGGANDDSGYSVVQTLDGGYAIAGRTNSYGAGGYDFWLVKTDASGYHMWNSTFGGSGSDVAWSVVQTNDGGYAIAGYTNSFGAMSYDFWLVKTDSVGNHLWNRTYGGAGPDDAYSLVQTGYGGYALAGETGSYGAGAADFWLVFEVGQLGFSVGLSMTDSTNSTITFYRGSADPFWNYMRVRMWLIKEPTWIYGDINMDGVVDVQDLFILSQNYGKTFSLLSLSGIITIAGIHQYKKRKQPK